MGTYIPSTSSCGRSASVMAADGSGTAGIAPAGTTTPCPGRNARSSRAADASRSSAPAGRRAAGSFFNLRPRRRTSFSSRPGCASSASPGWRQRMPAGPRLTSGASRPIPAATSAKAKLRPSTPLEASPWQARPGDSHRIGSLPRGQTRTKSPPGPYWHAAKLLVPTSRRPGKPAFLASVWIIGYPNIVQTSRQTLGFFAFSPREFRRIRTESPAHNGYGYGSRWAPTGCTSPIGRRWPFPTPKNQSRRNPLPLLGIGLAAMRVGELASPTGSSL